MRLIVLVLALRLTLVPLAGEGQQTETIRKIGWLSSGTRSNKSDLQTAFLRGLQELGYEVGRDVTTDRYHLWSESACRGYGPSGVARAAQLGRRRAPASR